MRNDLKKEEISREPQRKFLVDARGQRWITRLLWADRKATQIQITTCYDPGVQDSVVAAEHHSDGEVRLWCKHHESVDPSCFLSVVPGGGGVTWDVFSAHFGWISTNRALFKCWPRPSFCATVWPPTAAPEHLKMSQHSNNLVSCCSDVLLIRSAYSHPALLQHTSRCR